MVAALVLLGGPGLTACSSPPPAPPRQPVGVETSVATRYYPVRGTTTAAIFAATRTAGSCADLEKAIDAEWRAQQADIERAQAEFHAVDETTARSEREALQARLDDTRARLEPVDAEIRRLDTELADLRRQVDAGRADLVAQHNTLAGRRGALAEEYNRLVADANGLIDALNWARW